MQLTADLTNLLSDYGFDAVLKELANQANHHGLKPLAYAIDRARLEVPNLDPVRIQPATAVSRDKE